MSQISNIAVLFHAYNIDSGFSSTKISKVFKMFSEESGNFQYSQEKIRGDVFNLLGLPSDKAWQQSMEEVRISLDTGVQVITYLDSNYPAELRHIADPPLVLFISGGSKIDSKFWESFDRISIVGSRTTSQYGVLVTKQLSKKLVLAGNSIVSGLAYGIDKAAHEGAVVASHEMESVGIRSHPCPTISVLGSGLLELYPKVHADLAREIVNLGGLIISEYGLYLKPRTYLFPRRNRIVSGLSQSVVIIEARKKSGSLITARLALEQGKDLYCVPGPIDSSLSEGVNELIRDGAGVISNIDEFVSLKTSKKLVLPQNLNSKIEVSGYGKGLNRTQQKLCEVLSEGRKTFEDLFSLGIADEETLRYELYELEMKDVVSFMDGGYQLSC